MHLSRMACFVHVCAFFNQLPFCVFLSRFVPIKTACKKRGTLAGGGENLRRNCHLAFLCPFLCHSGMCTPLISAFFWGEGGLASKFLRFMFFLSPELTSLSRDKRIPEIWIRESLWCPYFFRPQFRPQFQGRIWLRQYYGRLGRFCRRTSSPLKILFLGGGIFGAGGGNSNSIFMGAGNSPLIRTHFRNVFQKVLVESHLLHLNCALTSQKDCPRPTLWNEIIVSIPWEFN